MALVTVTQSNVWEDAGATLMARVVGNDGTAIQQADVSALSYCIFDLDSATPTVATASGSLVVADTVYDTLQTDAKWSLDSTGYNFQHVVAASELTTADHTYRVEYWFNPVAGEHFPIVFVLETARVYGSVGGCAT